MILLLATACPRPPALPPPAEVPEPTPGSARTPITGPAYWVEPGGLCLEVPAGWSGTSGPPPLLLQITQPESGFGLELSTWTSEPLPPRQGFSLLFDDQSAYRSIPIFPDGALVQSWLADDPTGPMIQTWSGPVGDRMLEVAASYPLGRTTEGELVIQPLIEAICTTWR